MFSRDGCPFCVRAKGMLNDAGIRFDSDKETLQAIARQNGRSPQAIYHIMQGAQATAPPNGRPDVKEPAPGTWSLGCVMRSPTW